MLFGVNTFTFIFRALSRRFYPKRLTNVKQQEDQMGGANT
jgi:hypothetical protein